MMTSHDLYIEIGRFLHHFNAAPDKAEHHSRGKFSGKFTSGVIFLELWRILETKKRIAFNKLPYDFYFQGQSYIVLILIY